MPRMVSQFGRAYPRVKVALHEGSNRELHAALLGDEIDLAFIRFPVARPTGIDYIFIEDDVMCVALPLDHALLVRPSLALSDIQDVPMIGYSPVRANALRMAFLQVFNNQARSPVITQEATQVPTVIGLVEAGLGLALVPSATSRQSESRVMFRHIEDLPKTARIRIALAFRMDDHTRVARFLEVAEKDRDQRTDT